MVLENYVGSKLTSKVSNLLNDLLLKIVHNLSMMQM